LKTYFLTPSPTYATNQKHLKNFGRGLEITWDNKPDKIKRDILYQKYEYGGLTKIKKL